MLRWSALPAWAVTFGVGVVSCGAAAAGWVARGRPLVSLWPRAHGGAVVLMGVLFLVNNLTFLGAYEKTTVANAVLTHYTAPVLVAALAPFTLGERLLPTTVPALGMALAGLALLLSGAGLSLDDRHLQGILLGTASGGAYAVLILMARYYTLRVPALSLIFAQNLVIVGILLPWAGWRGVFHGARSWAFLAGMGVVHATAAPLAYLAGLRRTRAQVAAILGYLEPLCAVVWGAAFLGETPGAGALLGGGLLLAGGALVVWDEGRGEKPVDAPDGRR
ncbi:MAG: hypothetical protein Kow0092_05900 [Deferrisomatales bacterium]